MKRSGRQDWTFRRILICSTHKRRVAYANLVFIRTQTVLTTFEKTHYTFGRRIHEIFWDLKSEIYIWNIVTSDSFCSPYMGFKWFYKIKILRYRTFASPPYELPYEPSGILRQPIPHLCCHDTQLLILFCSFMCFLLSQ